MRTGFVERENTMKMNVMMPPRYPSTIKSVDSGIEKAVKRAVNTVIPSRIPVFSAVPSIDMVVDSSAMSKPSHQGLSW